MSKVDRWRGNGADELSAGMYAYAAAFLQPGDEVILFEPCESTSSSFAGSRSSCAPPDFDQYVAQVRFKSVLLFWLPLSTLLTSIPLRSGGFPVFVPIRAPASAATGNVSASEWKVNMDELRAAITCKTKQIWVNVRAAQGLVPFAIAHPPRYRPLTILSARCLTRMNFAALVILRRSTTS